jgi:hypothetical protein
MDTDASTDIVEGILAYLREHFPDSEFTEYASPDLTGNTLLQTRDGQYRLAVTETFLDGDDGAATPLRWIREWNLARELRAAKGRLVTVRTDGLRVGD